MADESQVSFKSSDRFGNTFSDLMRKTGREFDETAQKVAEGDIEEESEEELEEESEEELEEEPEEEPEEVQEQEEFDDDDVRDVIEDLVTTDFSDLDDQGRFSELIEGLSFSENEMATNFIASFQDLAGDAAEDAGIELDLEE